MKFSSDALYMWQSIRWPTYREKKSKISQDDEVIIRGIGAGEGIDKDEEDDEHEPRDPVDRPPGPKEVI